MNRIVRLSALILAVALVAPVSAGVCTHEAQECLDYLLTMRNRGYAGIDIDDRKDDGTMTITNTGVLTIAAAADMTLDGAFLQDGSGAVSLAGDITTTNDGIQFDSMLTLTGNVALSTGAGAGAVTFNDTVDAQTAGTETLTVTAGTGDVTFAAAVGGSTAVGGLDLNVTAFAALLAMVMSAFLILRRPSE